jgi:hypothetical protein
MVKLIGFGLIIAGILALVYQGFSYTETKQDAKIGPLTIQHPETENIPLPPVIGAIFIVAGLGALIADNRRLI